MRSGATIPSKVRKGFLEALQLYPGFQQAKQNLAGLPSSP
jgi:hypothetical protein